MPPSQPPLKACNLGLSLLRQNLQLAGAESLSKGSSGINNNYDCMGNDGIYLGCSVMRLGW